MSHEFLRSDQRHSSLSAVHPEGVAQVVEARVLRLEADARAQDASRGAPPPPPMAELSSASVDIWFREQPARGARRLDAALARVPLRTLPVVERPNLRAASLYALAGRPDRARTVLAQYATEVTDSALLRQREPERHNALAEIALAERRPLDAVAEFRLGDRRPDGLADWCTTCLPARLGRAYDLANVPDSAIAMYERYISTPHAWRLWGPYRGTPPGSGRDPSLLAGMQKRLGELYEAKGERDKAVGY